MLQRLLKTVPAATLGLIPALPGILLYRLSRSIGVFRGFAELYSLVPGLPGRYARAWYYHGTLKKCPLNLNMNFLSKFNYPDSEVGDGVMIGAYCNLGLVCFMDKSGCAERTSILSRRAQHNYSDSNRLVLSQDNEPDRVVIGYDSHVLAGCIVMAHVGEKSIVGAGSIVVRNIEPYSVAVGNPARVIKKREAGVPSGEASGVAPPGGVRS